MADIAGAATAALNGQEGSGSGSAGISSPPPAPATPVSPPPAAAPNPTPSSSPQRSVASPTPAPASVSSGGTGGDAPAVGAGAAGGGAGDWMGIRDAARQYGFDMGNVGDDHAALQQLIMQAQRSRQLEQMAQYGQLYMQHAGQFQQWQREQQESQARQQQQQAQWFKAPEWNANWRNMIVRDPQSGEYKPAPGAPPDVVQKYLTGLQHQTQFLEQFAFDPIGAIKPGIQQLVQEMAQQIVQQQLGGYQERSFAQSFIRDNSTWLYQQDQNGNPVKDFQGNRALSQWGQAFRSYVAEAEQAGIRDEQARANYALRMVRGDFLSWQQQQAAAQQQGGAAGKQQFLQQAAAAQAANTPAPQPQPAVNGGNGAQGRQARQPKVPLSDRIKQRFAAAGIDGSALMAKPPAK